MVCAETRIMPGQTATAETEKRTAVTQYNMCSVIGATKHGSTYDSHRGNLVEHSSEPLEYSIATANLKQYNVN